MHVSAWRDRSYWSGLDLIVTIVHSRSTMFYSFYRKKKILKTSIYLDNFIFACIVAKRGREAPIIHPLQPSNIRKTQGTATVHAQTRPKSCNNIISVCGPSRKQPICIFELSTTSKLNQSTTALNKANIISHLKVHQHERNLASL